MIQDLPDTLFYMLNKCVQSIQININHTHCGIKKSTASLEKVFLNLTVQWIILIKKAF